MNLKKLGAAAAVIVTLLVGLVAKEIGKTIGGTLVPRKSLSKIMSLEEKRDVLAQQVAKEMKSYPKLVDASTRADSVSVDIHNNEVRLTYKFTVLDWSINMPELQSLKQEATRSLIATVCSNSTIKAAFENGIEYEYVYFFKDGKSLSDITLNKARCAENKKAEQKNDIVLTPEQMDQALSGSVENK